MDNRAGDLSIDGSYRDIVRYVERCFDQHGDNHLGVGWPNRADALTRYQVMLEVIRPGTTTPCSLLDFGCGLAHLYQYILDDGRTDIDYFGLDISTALLTIARAKYPSISFYEIDVLRDDQPLPHADYVVMNGVFTVKSTLSFDEMRDYAYTVLQRVFPTARVGLAFNVMSKNVDWERDDLFHLPLDDVTGFLTRHLSRNYIIRNDYGLYEYTAYVFH
jgi:SAM-dependent methyltransferase